MLLRDRPHPSSGLRGRVLAGVILPLALGGALAGCGDDDEKAAASPAPQTTPAAAPATTPATESPMAAARRAKVDKAFVRQMIPHHELAVAMAKVAVDRANHPELKTLAEGIVKQQTRETRRLKLFAKQLGVKASAADDETTMTGDAITLGTTMDQLGMSMDAGKLKDLSDDAFDAAFVDQMVDHHYGAIAMANGEILHGDDTSIKAIATKISLAQTREVAKMVAWKGKW